MRRFFLPRDAICDGTATVSGDLFRHMVRVLRLKRGTRVLLADGAGGEYAGRIERIGRERLTINIEEERAEGTAERTPRITLFQGLPKGSKMELILQKCSELGVAELVPYVSGRTVPRLPPGREEERLRRWRRIAGESARQSNRSSIPRVAGIREFSEAVRSADEPVKLLLWEGETANGLRAVVAGIPAPESVAVLIGPEGGLSAEEAGEAMANGFIPVTLGRRILRTETAGIAVLAILQFLWGDLG